MANARLMNAGRFMHDEHQRQQQQQQQQQQPSRQRQRKQQQRRQQQRRQQQRRQQQRGGDGGGGGRGGGVAGTPLSPSEVAAATRIDDNGEGLGPGLDPGLGHGEGEGEGDGKGMGMKWLDDDDAADNTNTNTNARARTASPKRGGGRAKRTAKGKAWIYPDKRGLTGRQKEIRERTLAQIAKEKAVARGTDVPLDRRQIVKNKKLKDASIQQYIRRRARHREAIQQEEAALSTPGGLRALAAARASQPTPLLTPRPGAREVVLQDPEDVKWNSKARVPLTERVRALTKSSVDLYVNRQQRWFERTAKDQSAILRRLGVERGGVSGAGGVEVGLGGDIEVYEPPHSLDEAQAMDDMIKWEEDEAERKKREAAGPLRPR